MIILHIFIFAFFIFLYFFRDFYLGELAISFLPYIGGFLLLLVIYRIIQLRKYLYGAIENQSLLIKTSPFFLILFGILFGLYAYELNHFYNEDLLSKEPLNNPIKILYSNIYKENYNFDKIKETIQSEDPDIVMFVEFSDEHEDGLKDFINEHYPYYDKTNRSRIFGGNVVMSKYPITNFINKYKQESAWKYGYFMIEKDATPYYFYLIHTSSPVSKLDYEKRNQQLISVKKDFFQTHDSERSLNAKIIMLGDFNVSPWSSNYKAFDSSISGRLKNITRIPPMFFSWNLAEMLKVHKDFDFLPQRFKKNVGYCPILRSHIDQAFISPSVKIANFKKIHIDGSDHDGIVFDIE